MKLEFDAYGADDAPTVVLLHGAGSPPAALQPIVDGLRDDYRVIVPYRNGYGRTGSHPADPEGELDAIAEFGGDSFSIVGHSFGTFRAFQLAHRIPERLRRIVAISPLPGVPEPARKTTEKLVALLRSDLDFVEVTATRWTSENYAKSHPEMLDVARGWLGQTDQNLMAEEYLECLDQGRTLGRLAESDVDVRLFVGEVDQITPAAIAQMVDAMCPNATLHVEPNVGHLPMLECPEILVEWVRANLS